MHSVGGFSSPSPSLSEAFLFFIRHTKSYSTVRCPRAGAINNLALTAPESGNSADLRVVDHGDLRQPKTMPTALFALTECHHQWEDRTQLSHHAKLY